MKRASLIILCLIVSICGYSKSPELPKNYIANSVEWHDDDMLVYHAEDALYAYQPSDGTTKNLLSEELTGIHWNINDRNSRYIGSSSDKSKYILSTDKRLNLHHVALCVNAFFEKFSFFHCRYRKRNTRSQGSGG